MTAASSKFPARYEPLERLGEGGSGEVWAARDRVTNRRVALKLLREGAEQAEVMALVREATALSCIESLGVPRVLHFGRLPTTGRVYLVRELVEGTSLADRLEAKENARVCLLALVQAADLLTNLHRGLLLHGDIKPANIIVGPDGTATLVDLGLAAPWREGGARPEGLTPRYAAPELFRGEPLTPQVEVYALGASLEDIIEKVGAELSARELYGVRAVAVRATADLASERFPSVDEFAEALRLALALDDRTGPSPGGASDGGVQHTRRLWSIVGNDGVSNALLARIEGMLPREGLLLGGPEGSGRSTLLRRIAWSLGVGGASVVFIESPDPTTVALALDPSMRSLNPEEVVLLVDDADMLEPADFARMEALRATGARLVAVVGGRAGGESLASGRTFGWFEAPPLEEADAVELVARFIPSLGDAMVRLLLARSGGYPGPLRSLVERLESRAIVSPDDLDSALDDAPIPAGVRIELAEIHRLLDRGRLDAAADYLSAYDRDVSVSLAVARAKVAIGRGEPKGALAELARAEAMLSEATRVDVVAWSAQRARAHLRAGDYENAEIHASRALSTLGTSVDASHEELAAAGSLEFTVDALAVAGLARSLSGRHELAADTLQRSVDLARTGDEPRVLAIALGSLAFALQRSDRLTDAEAAHAEALMHAEKAGDAGHIATTRLNLATIAHSRGDFAVALAHLEAAVDMGRRSGRTSTVRQALFNLASLDLYLGREARAQASLAALAAERSSLSGAARAQLLALEAESLAHSGDLELGARKCIACAEAYHELGRRTDAAEALFESVLITLRGADVDPVAMQDEILAAESLLADSGAHQPLARLARGKVAMVGERWSEARLAFDEAIDAAERSGQRDWVWRALVARAELAAAESRPADQAADHRRAVEIVEAIAAPLPRDLREVFWSDPRRRFLRSGNLGRGSELRTGAIRATLKPTGVSVAFGPDISAATQLVMAPREDRLAMLLDINRELAGEYDLDRLLERVTDRAITLLDAERGFVLLRSRSGEPRLSVHAARDREGNEPHVLFSRSIAERVLASGEAFLAVDAASDERVSEFVSVHQLMLRSVACVPIHARQGDTIGALYVETRLRAGGAFGLELPTLAAFAEQSAIAIETARLIEENRARAVALETSNRELSVARDKLEELLGRRTEQLQETKRSLRTARAALRSHFGYGGIVGTSAAMRRVYAVIDRVKDADVPILLTGESGTGKEVVARTIHSMGARTQKPFVGVNCGAIPEHLLESELFGHVRGSFTGADRDKKGLFRELDGGTILLDEIGEMAPKMQAGLLRVLQERVVRPVGGAKEESVDVRVIAATHRNLTEMVERGTFREDLYYRLNVIELRLPSLRERAEDVPLLVDHFLGIFAARYGRERRSVSREALRRLQGHSWPGNVRQLENLLLNAWILSDEEELGLADFDVSGVAASAKSLPTSAPGAIGEPSREPQGASGASGRPESAEDFSVVEREQILEALGKCGWNRAEAARLLGIPRRTFYRRLERYGIQ